MIKAFKGNNRALVIALFVFLLIDGDLKVLAAPTTTASSSLSSTTILPIGASVQSKLATVDYSGASDEFKEQYLSMWRLVNHTSSETQNLQHFAQKLFETVDLVQIQTRIGDFSTLSLVEYAVAILVVIICIVSGIRNSGQHSLNTWKTGIFFLAMLLYPIAVIIASFMENRKEMIMRITGAVLALCVGIGITVFVGHQENERLKHLHFLNGDDDMNFFSFDIVNHPDRRLYAPFRSDFCMAATGQINRQVFVNLIRPLQVVISERGTNPLGMDQFGVHYKYLTPEEKNNLKQLLIRHNIDDENTNSKRFMKLLKLDHNAGMNVFWKMVSEMVKSELNGKGIKMNEFDRIDGLLPINDPELTDTLNAIGNVNEYTVKRERDANRFLLRGAAMMVGDLKVVLQHQGKRFVVPKLDPDTAEGAALKICKESGDALPWMHLDDQIVDTMAHDYGAVLTPGKKVCIRVDDRVVRLTSQLNIWILLSDRLCALPLGMLELAKGNAWTIAGVQSCKSHPVGHYRHHLQATDFKEAKVHVPKMEFGDMIIFQSSAVIHGALPIYDSKCNDRCRRSVEFRAYTYIADNSCDEPGYFDDPDHVKPRY